MFHELITSVPASLRNNLGEVAGAEDLVGGFLPEDILEEVVAKFLEKAANAASDED